MSTIDHHTLDLTPHISEAGVGDYIALLKPRVMSLVVFTALVGYLMERRVVAHPVLAVTSILCIAVGAGASGALNMWYDRDIDALMSRTAQPADSARPHHAARGADLRHDAGVLLGGDARHPGELDRRGAAGLHDLLLCA